MASKKTVLVRIRRMGKQFATCGIGVRPPEDMIHNPAMKRLCPKLVPGQVIRLPADHPLLRDENDERIEVVTKIGRDEFERPWVFDTVEHALSADPSKSGLSADQIADGLALIEGATFNQRNKLEKRDAAKEATADDDSEEDPEADVYSPDDEDDEDDEEEVPVEKRAQNRVTRDLKEEARPIRDPRAKEDDEDSVKPVSRRGRRGTRG